MEETLTDLGPYADIITALAAVLGVLTALITLLVLYSQLRHQSASRDTASLLELLHEIAAHWERMRSCNANDWEFHFGQLLSFYETACYLANSRIMSKRVRRLLSDHIIEVLVQIISDDRTLGAMKKISSGRETYREIIKFFRENSRSYERHWNFLKEVGWTST